VTSDGSQTRRPGAPGTIKTPGTATDGFAESQQAGLDAMIGLATTANARAGTARLEATSAIPNAVTDQPDQVPDWPDASKHVSREGAAVWNNRGFARAPALSLIAILTVQAVLSARLISAYTAFNDEALYLWAGRIEWSHWLHGTAAPPFQTYFSGAPVIYPPLSALANGLGGLAGARILSLCFMLGATVLLWSTASRLYDWRIASVAAAFWAVLGPTQHLGAYATYDGMALFLVALAAWCATGRRDKDDATGWILAAAVALALANATKYASAIFDPVVIALSVVSAWPQPGGKVALRRGTLLIACLAGTLALGVRFGGPLYLRGIQQTTIDRTGSTSPILTVLSESWAWVGSIAAVAAVAVFLSWRRPNGALTALLASAVLLVPIEQARIHTVTSLNKHVDFGAWFAAIAAGYAIRRIVAMPRPRIIRATAVCGCVALGFASGAVGVLQARKMLYGYSPNEARLIAALQPLTSHGGRFLAEGQSIPEYYLHGTSWQEWSNTRSVILPSGRTVSVPVGGEGNPAVYSRLITSHYFSVVLLTFTDTVTLDNAITADLKSTSGYHIASTIPFGPTARGEYTIWVYQPPADQGGG
jgi:4-amino-4-deoxy-L-arabinose transferase-like glycosyltransferase